MKQKSLLITGLLIILSLILFAMVGCEPVRHTRISHSYRPRTYVQFDHYWVNNRPYYQPRVIIIQPKQPRRQSNRRGKH
jgi:hypothetical protein